MCNAVHVCALSLRSLMQLFPASVEALSCVVGCHMSITAALQDWVEQEQQLSRTPSHPRCTRLSAPPSRRPHRSPTPLPSCSCWWRTTCGPPACTPLQTCSPRRRAFLGCPLAAKLGSLQMLLQSPETLQSSRILLSSPSAHRGTVQCRPPSQAEVRPTVLCCSPEMGHRTRLPDDDDSKTRHLNSIGR